MEREIVKNVRVGLLAVLTLALLVMVFATPLGAGRGEEDFLGYWSAARQLVIGSNPYDQVALRTLQHQVRPDRIQLEGLVVSTWNPPWLLVILLPFGLLPFDIAARLWILCNIGIFGLAPLVLWRMTTGSSDGRGAVLALLAGLLFGGSLLSIKMGQITGLVLVGLIVYLWLLRAGHDGWAGVALLLTTIKLHLMYFVLLLIVIWVIRRRRWWVGIGLIIAGLITTAIVWAIFPNWLTAYLMAMGAHPPHATATVGGLAQALLGTSWFNFVGVLLLPFAPLLTRLAETRGWLTAMNLALLMSIPVAPYGFAFDQVLLLPAIIQLVAWLWQKQLPRQAAWIVAGGLMLTYAVLLWMLIRYSLPYYWFLWVPLVLLGLYLFALKQPRIAPKIVDLSP